jgi:hypothetical protein
MDHWINLIPILILTAACLFIMLTDDWRKILISYAVIYISAFSIITQYWSFSFSLVKLITGLMSLVVLGLSINKHFEVPQRKLNAEFIFRLVALFLIFVIMVFLVNQISNYLSIPLEIALASLLMIGFSVFQLGISLQPRRIILAILTLFFGFELIFSANESSLLVNGLLALVSLLVALMGGYMIVNEFESDEE